MPNNTASLAPSEAPLIPTPDQTSFTGRARPAPKGGGLWPLAAGDGGFAGGAGGAAEANVAPPRFDTGRRVLVPVQRADLALPPPREEPGKKRWWKRSSAPSEVVMVPMDSEEYKLWFAKDEKGCWRDGVVEPEMGRGQWVEARLAGRI